MIIFGLTIFGFWFELAYYHEDNISINLWNEPSKYYYGTEFGFKGLSVVLYTPIKRKQNARPKTH